MSLESSIEGVRVLPLKRIPDHRGTVSHMLRASDPWFLGFGEIYFSSVHPGIVKGWHRHDPATLNYACVSGLLKVALYDDREDSATRGVLEEFYLGDPQYLLLQVPPKVWNGFQAVGTETAIVANCCTHEHGSFRSERMDPFDNPIDYDWFDRGH